MGIVQRIKDDLHRTPMWVWISIGIAAATLLIAWLALHKPSSSTGTSGTTGNTDPGVGGGGTGGVGVTQPPAFLGPPVTPPDTGGSGIDTSGLGIPGVPPASPAPTPPPSGGDPGGGEENISGQKPAGGRQAADIRSNHGPVPMTGKRVAQDIRSNHASRVGAAASQAPGAVHPRREPPHPEPIQGHPTHGGRII